MSIPDHPAIILHLCEQTWNWGSSLKGMLLEDEFNNLEDPHDHYRSIAPLRLLKVKEKCPEVWERLGYLMDHNEDRIKERKY